MARPAHGQTKQRKRSGRHSPGRAAGSAKKNSARQNVAGLAARDLAVRLLHDVLSRRLMLDEAFETWTERAPFDSLEPRDRGLARLLTATALRYNGQIRDAQARYIEKTLPKETGRLRAILDIACGALLFLDGAPHAAINIAVEQCKRDYRANRYQRLANAVLRRVAEARGDILATQDAAELNIPSWLFDRWCRSYGPQAAREIALASLREAPRDLTVKAGGAQVAEKLAGDLLATGSIRLTGGGAIQDLPGFASGEWWVQDAAAALPVRLLGDISGCRVADLCAAPGGKTAQLIVAGAIVTAVDNAPNRLARLKENLARLKLTAELVEADVLSWAPDHPFDVVVLDAPCTATGTIRRHPDLIHLKAESDIRRLAELQRKMLSKAVQWVRPGGRLLYCTCSLEHEEGQDQMAWLQEQNCDISPIAVDTTAVPGLDPGWLTASGALRTLPCHSIAGRDDVHQGMDGFFAAVMQRQA